jgi:peptide/nickel transport system ATP-binding protein
MSAGRPVLTVASLGVTFGQTPEAPPAISDVSFTLAPGRVLALVGESGSGKSVTALSIMGLLTPRGRVTAGRIELDGLNLLGLDERAWRRVRGREIAMVFQEPMTALNPVLRIGAQMCETLQAHQSGLSRANAWQRCRDLLGTVGIVDPDAGMNAWPQAFSGGMLQRVCIAMAIMHQPKVIIADEPTTALDVTVQAQILTLVSTLTASTGSALLWITHDLTVARALADDVGVMSRGRIVEYGRARETLTAPRHPYAQQLLANDERLRRPLVTEARAHD